jgi:hypothetical protein
MAYSQAKMKEAMVIKHLVSDQSEQEMHQVYFFTYVDITVGFI